MPISAWICPSCNKQVDIDHFSKTKCGEVVHPDFAEAIIKDRSTQYVSGQVRVSHGLSCPRAAAIEHFEEYAVNPLNFNAQLTGTAWHKIVEGSEGSEVVVKGRLEGIKVVGRVDRIRVSGGDLVVEDWKHGSDKAIARRAISDSKRDVLQLSVYAELHSQSYGVRPNRGIIWGHSSLNGSDAFSVKHIQLMEIKDAINSKPFNGDYSVIELYKQADDAFNKGVVWRNLPKAGQTMELGSRTVCDYCSFYDQCNDSPF